MSGSRAATRSREVGVFTAAAAAAATFLLIVVALSWGGTLAWLAITRPAVTEFGGGVPDYFPVVVRTPDGYRLVHGLPAQGEGVLVRPTVASYVSWSDEPFEFRVVEGGVIEVRETDVAWIVARYRLDGARVVPLYWRNRYDLVDGPKVMLLLFVGVIAGWIAAKHVFRRLTR